MNSNVFEIDQFITVTRPHVSQGDMNGTEVEGIITVPSPTAHEEPQAVGVFRTIARSIEMIPIREIIPYDGIPDYREPTSAEHPIVTITPHGKFCIEGQELIQAAMADGAEEVLCETEVLEEHSETELTIRKGASRVASRGGLARYPEIIRNVTSAEIQLLSSGTDLRRHGHGGKRFGEGFVNEPETDVRHLLCRRFTKKRKTIDAYLLHGEYLSEGLLQALVEGDAPKKFFEKCQPKKRKLLDELAENRASEQEKVESVSARMLEFFEDYRKAPQENDQSSCQQQQPETPASLVETSQATSPAPTQSCTIPLQSGSNDGDEEDVPSEAEDCGDEAAADLASGNIEEDSDDVLSEPEDERGEIPAQSSSNNEVEDEGVITINDEQASSPRALTMDDVYDAIDSVAERLADLPDMDLSPVALARSIEDEIGILTDLKQQLLRIED